MKRVFDCNKTYKASKAHILSQVSRVYRPYSYSSLKILAVIFLTLPTEQHQSIRLVFRIRFPTMSELCCTLYVYSICVYVCTVYTHTWISLSISYIFSSGPRSLVMENEIRLNGTNLTNLMATLYSEYDTSPLYLVYMYLQDLISAFSTIRLLQDISYP